MKATSRAVLARRWRGGLPPPLSWLLAPVAWAYRAGLGAHRALYRAGIRRATRLDRPVVSVGNLVVGGTGKTPVVEVLARRLVAGGRRVVILSRGYGRGGSGVAAVSDGQRVMLDPEEAGDEPVLLARRLPGVPVVVGADRGRAGRWALERFGPDVVVLDDGFQHWRLHRDVDVVCLDGRRPWGPGRLLPAGPLREPPPALARAHAIVLTEPGATGDAVAARAAVHRVAPAAAIAVGTYHPAGLVAVPGGTRADVAVLGGRPVLAFAGIAVPERFEFTLAAAGVRVLRTIAYPDHHRFAPRDLWDLTAEARRLGATALVTTEKDAVRLVGAGSVPLPVWALRVDLVLEEAGGAWWAAVESRLAMVTRG